MAHNIDIVWKYNKEKHSVVEQPTMDEPIINSAILQNLSVSATKVAIEILNEYNTHIASLRSIPVQGVVDWKNSEDVTGKFKEQYEIRNVHNDWMAVSVQTYVNSVRSRRIVAIPIKQEQPQPDGDEVEIILPDSLKELMDKNQSQEQPKQEAILDVGKWYDFLSGKGEIAADIACFITDAVKKEAKIAEQIGGYVHEIDSLRGTNRKLIETIESDAVEFADFIKDENYNHWNNVWEKKGQYFTTEELYKLFKNKKG